MLWCTVDSGEFDPVLDLVDGRGAVIASNDGAGTHSELWQRVEQAGGYEFRVRGFESRGGGNYQYRLHRFRTGPLAKTGEAEHTFGESQWWHYRVALQQGEVLVPTVLGDGRLTAVLDDQRVPLGEQFGGYRAPRTGDYFVRIEGAKDHRCQVLTQLARVGDHAMDERTNERIAAYGLDTWRFRLPAGQCIVLDVRMPDVLVNVEVEEQQPDARGPAFVPMGHFEKGGVVRRLFFVRRECGLELFLRHRGSAAVPYEVALRTWGRDTKVGERVEDELPLGDDALFHVPLAAGEMVEVAAASDQFDAAIDVFDPDGNLIGQNDDRSLTDRNPLHRFLVTRPGTYHALVHCGRVASGAFTLRTASQPLPRLEVGAALAVRWGSHVHLDLTCGDVVWLSLRSCAFDAALQVIDPTGDSGFVAEGGGLGGDVLVAYRCSHTGRHTLVVHARDLRQGDGELRVVRP
jgi:hypothetical protein